MPNKEPIETIDQESAAPVDANTADVEAGADASEHDAEAGAQDQKETDSTLDQLKQELVQARAKAEENWNNLLRSKADLENLRKRSQRDLENAHKYSIEKFATELLPVKDSLELGLDHSSEETSAEKLHEGMELTLKMFKQLMEKFQIEEIDPKGEPFDPKKHQAMTMQDNSELAPNTILAVMQKGYTLNDRLLRPAMVIVSRNPEDSN